MRKMLALMTFASAAMLTLSPVAAADAKKAAPPAAITTETDKVATVAGWSKRARHARSWRRHRAARVHRNRWRNIWVYTAHDRHGYRHYEYVRRKLHGYFASTRGTRAFPRSSGYRTEYRWHI